LIEQPKTFVFSTGTGLPARTASIALRASDTVTLAGFSPSSTPAGEAQRALLVEDEHVRRGRGPVGVRDRLRLAVVEVGKSEVPLLRRGSSSPRSESLRSV
jgi:hypothetical protein